MSAKNDNACNVVSATILQAKGKRMIKLNIINYLISVNPAVVAGLLFAAGGSC